jgi:hypothetical protein
MPSQKEYMQAWYLRNRERILAEKKAEYDANPAPFRAKTKRNYDANPELMMSRNRDWRELNPVKHRVMGSRGQSKKLGHALPPLSFDDKAFDLMLKQQDNRCLVCFEEFSSTPFIDHCHTTGEVRGLLHPKCNTVVGFAEHPLIYNAQEYCRKWKDKKAVD